MITPALLILGSGSLVATALQRLARAVDRARALVEAAAPDEPHRAWAARYAHRAEIAERAVTLFFVAVGVFVLACLSLALDRAAEGRLTWLPVGLTIAGMGLMLGGVGLMLRESHLATLQIREEIGDMGRVKARIAD